VTDGRREALTRLAHDVGKYVSRAARNIPAPPAVPPRALVDMMIKDLYLLDGQERASAVFARLADGLVGIPLLERARQLLREIDDIEQRVRAAEPHAVEFARALALEVAELLRDVVEPRRLDDV
jgi:hypothetical protein